MKNLILVSLLAIFAFACNSDDSSTKRYGIKSGIIVYKNSLMGMEYKVTQYFKKYGEIEASVTEMDMMGQKNTQTQLRLDGWYYSYSQGQTQGAKFKINAPEDSTESEMLTEEAILKKGGKKVGEEKILEKNCTVYEFEEMGSKSKIWVWKNMILKMVASQGEMEVVMEAVELKETSDFPDGIFEIPASINFVEMPNQTQDFENMEGMDGMDEMNDSLESEDINEDEAKG